MAVSLAISLLLLNILSLHIYGQDYTVTVTVTAQGNVDLFSTMHAQALIQTFKSTIEFQLLRKDRIKKTEKRRSKDSFNAKSI